MTLMTIKEAQDYLRKSKSAFYRDMKNGVIKVIHIGSKPLVVKEQIDGLIKSQLQNA